MNEFIPPPTPKSSPHGGQIALLTLSAFVAITGSIATAVIWMFRQTSLANIGPNFGPLWMTLSYLALWVVLAAPLFAAGRFIKTARYQTVIRCWFWASISLLIFIPLRFLPYTAAQWTALAQLGLGISVLVVLRIQRPDSNPSGNRNAILAVACGAMLTIAWLLSGALGSLLDTVLNILAAIVFGLITAEIMRTKFDLDAFGSTTRWRDTALLALTIGGVLRLLSIGFGANGQQLILLIALPTLGWLAAVLMRDSETPFQSISIRPLPILIGIVVAAAIALFDGDELFIMLVGISADEALPIAMRTAAITAGLSLLLALIIGGMQRSLGSVPQIVAIGTAAVASIAALLLYGIGGQFGLHGEQMFVIMANQPDIQAVAEINDIDARRAAAYSELTTFANADQAEIRTVLERFRIDYTPYYLVNAIEVPANPLLRIYLNRRADVDRILENPHLRPLPDRLALSTGPHTQPSSPDWNLLMIDAPRVWDELGITGAGVTVGQSDSGVEWNHPELIESYRGNGSDHSYHWLDPWNADPVPYDQGGHGTHTLGTIVGKTVGVAPDAEWFGCSNLYRNLANPTLYLDCMQFMLAPYPHNGNAFTDGDPALGADVINNSWGCPEIEGCDADSLLVGTQSLRHAGVFIVASAGNDGPNCETVSSPISTYDEAFSVGAIDALGNPTGFSSRGPVTIDGSNRLKPDIVAPGEDILSATPGGTYDRFPGTSMAGPHVAGVVALMYSANPNLIGEIDTIEQILINTAVPITGNFSDTGCNADSVPNNTTGYGMVNAFAAVEAALAWQP